MKKILFILIIVVQSFSAMSQFQGNEYKNLEEERYYSIDGTSVIYSNSFSSEFINSIYNNTYISNDIKEMVNYSRSIKGINEVNAGMQFIWLPDSAKYKAGIFASVNARHIVAGNIAPDFYKLTMFGNKRFAGETADLSNSRLYLCDYQKISIGVSFRIPTETGTAMATVHLSPVKGQRYFEIETGSTWFYTSETGEMLSMQATAFEYSSDQSFRRNQDFAGTGLAAGGSLYFNNKESNFWVYTSATDIGFISWKHKSSITVLDTMFSFTGLYVDNIFEFDSSQLSISSDTLYRILEDYTDTTHFRRGLPETWYLEAGKYFPCCRITASGSLYYIFRTGMPLPRIQINGSWKLNDYIQPAISCSHGGSGKFAAGMGLISQPAEGLKIGIYTPDILSIVFPEYGYASGFTVRISYNY